MNTLFVTILMIFGVLGLLTAGFGVIRPLLTTYSGSFIEIGRQKEYIRGLSLVSVIFTPFFLAVISLCAEYFGI